MAKKKAQKKAAEAKAEEAPKAKAKAEAYKIAKDRSICCAARIMDQGEVVKLSDLHCDPEVAQSALESLLARGILIKA